MDSKREKKSKIKKSFLRISCFALFIYYLLILYKESDIGIIFFMVVFLSFGFLATGPSQILWAKQFAKWSSLKTYENLLNSYRFQKKHLLKHWIIASFFTLSAIVISFIGSLYPHLSVSLGFLSSGYIGVVLGLSYSTNKILPEEETDVDEEREESLISKEKRFRIFGLLLSIGSVISIVTFLLIFFRFALPFNLFVKPPFNKHPADFIMIGNLVLLICVFFIGLFLLLKSKGKSIELENPER